MLFSERGGADSPFYMNYNSPVPYPVLDSRNSPALRLNYLTFQVTKFNSDI